MEEKPLVSLLILFYNQEEFAEDAVKGALSQDYDNCEIILSDDCSTDKTFQIIEKITNDYTGNKKIIINKNEKNLGLVRHINKVLDKFTSGEIICLAGGDDISLKNRVSDTVRYFQNNANLTAVSMSYQIIDKTGKNIGKKQLTKDELLKISDKKYLTSNDMMWGLSGLSFSRIVLDVFGKLNDDCQTEDSILRFRSILIGEVLTSEKIGLKYRIHGNNLSIGSRVYKMETELMAKQYKKDLSVARQYISTKIRHILDLKINHYITYRNLSKKISFKYNYLYKSLCALSRYFSVLLYQYRIMRSERNITDWIKRKFRKLYNLLYFIINRKNLIVLTGYMQSKGSKILSNNFGDDINYDIVSYLSGGKKIFNITGNVLFGNKINAVNYACIGSISDTGFINKNTIVWGSGSMYGDINRFGVPKQVLAVRGSLTRNCFLKKGINCPQIYGDPALLLPLVYPCNEQKKYKFGLIPHYIDFNLQNVIEFQENYKDSVKVIDLKKYNNWREIVRQINQCEYILSSSLHGLIVSDAYNIPNIWIKLSNNVTGGYFKFWDYFSEVNRHQKEPINLMNKTIIPENVILEYQYEPITFDKDKLLKNCPFLK